MSHQVVVKSVAKRNQEILPARIAINLVNCRVREHVRVAFSKVFNVDLRQSFGVLIHSDQDSLGGNAHHRRFATKMASGARRLDMGQRLEDGSPQGPKPRSSEF